MAIAYQSTSVSDADAVAAGILAQSAIRDALVAHASGAWTLVEEFDSVGATIHWVVLKNDGVLSGVGFDFYVCIARLAATGQVGICVGEVYDAALNSLSFFAPRVGGSYYQNTILANFGYALNNGNVASTFTLGAVFPGGNVGEPVTHVPAAAPTMRFITMIEKDYAIVLLNNVVFYIGALTDQLVPDANLLAATPVGCFNFYDGNAPSFGALTRHPIDAANAPMQVAYSHCLMPITDQHTWLQRQALGTGIYTHPDRYQGKKVFASEVMALMFAGMTSGNDNNGGDKVGVVRGKFKNVRIASFPWAAAAFDTIVLDGRKHIILADHGQLDGGVFATPNNYSSSIRWGKVFDTGVAA